MRVIYSTLESNKERERERSNSTPVHAKSSVNDNNYFTDMCSGSEAGSYLRRIDFCITQL